MHVMHIAAMTFDQFLSLKRISDAEAAARLNRDVTLIGRYRKRRVNPSPEIIAEIYDWSKGKVPPRELLAISGAAQ